MNNVKLYNNSIVMHYSLDCTKWQYTAILDVENSGQVLSQMQQLISDNGRYATGIMTAWCMDEYWEDASDIANPNTVYVTQCWKKRLKIEVHVYCVALV